MEKPKLIKDLGIYTTPTNKSKVHYGLYECPFCLKSFIASIYNINHELKKSCGCKDFRYKHGLSDTRLYYIWYGIKARCYDKKTIHYADYGGRGIKMCKEWLDDKMKFYDWAVKNGYADNLEVDRIDNNGDYEPKNCRFANRSEQLQNSRTRKNNTSGFRGISNRMGRWRSIIWDKCRRYDLGEYKDIKDAVIARNDWIIKHHTRHPLINI